MRAAAKYFKVIDGKPNFSKIDLAEIEKKVSSIPLNTIKVDEKVKTRFKSVRKSIRKTDPSMHQVDQDAKGTVESKSSLPKTSDTPKRTLTEADKEEIKEICKQVFMELFAQMNKN